MNLKNTVQTNCSLNLWWTFNLFAFWTLDWNCTEEELDDEDYDDVGDGDEYEYDDGEEEDYVDEDGVPYVSLVRNSIGAISIEWIINLVHEILSHYQLSSWD